jgi:predicted amidohydrolase YtcJ
VKDALDAVVPERPVYLPSRDGHGASGQLEGIANVTRDTADRRRP